MIETGIDIIEISRVAKSIESPAFVKKYFHPVEIGYARRSKNTAQHFAARFAAKEAARKILLSYVDDLSWQDTWIENDETGKPVLRLSERVISRIKVNHASVSLSHNRNHAVAVALMDIG